MKYNPVFDAVISADTRGIFEYWDPATLGFSESGYVLVQLICLIILLHSSLFRFCNSFEMHLYYHALMDSSTLCSRLDFKD